MSPITTPLPQERPDEFGPAISIPWDRIPVSQADKSRGVPIADRYSLMGESDYSTWCTVMRSYLGHYAASAAMRISTCPEEDDAAGFSAFLAWDQFALNCIMVSIHSDFISLLETCFTSAQVWTALQQRFAPKGAQAVLRTLKKFWPLQLTGIDLTSLNKFKHQDLAVVTELKGLTIELDTPCSAHLLGALLPSLGALETTISVNNPRKLPSVQEIFTMVRNELARTAASSTSSAVGLIATGTLNKPNFKPHPAVKPPSPCKHCKGNHWNNLCPTKQGSSILSASLAASAWQASAALAGPHIPVQAALLDSGATYHMSGHSMLFQTFQSTPTSAVGGIAESANASGTRTIGLKLDSGTQVTLNDVLYVPGMQATLISTHRLHANQGLVTVFGDRGTSYSGDKAVATATKQANGLYQVDVILLSCELPSLALAAAAASHT